MNPNAITPTRTSSFIAAEGKLSFKIVSKIPFHNQNLIQFHSIILSTTERLAMNIINEPPYCGIDVQSLGKWVKSTISLFSRELYKQRPNCSMISRIIQQMWNEHFCVNHQSLHFKGKLENSLLYIYPTTWLLINDIL